MKRPAFGFRETWVPVLGLPFISCGTLGQLHHLSELQFHDGPKISLFLGAMKEMFGEHLARSKAPFFSNCSKYQIHHHRLHYSGRLRGERELGRREMLGKGEK